MLPPEQQPARTTRRDSPGPLFALALAAVSLIGPLAVHLYMPVIPAAKAALRPLAEFTGSSPYGPYSCHRP
jgi:hypothetical protein